MRDAARAAAAADGVPGPSRVAQPATHGEVVDRRRPHRAWPGRGGGPSRALELLDLVGAETPAAARYPHQFSGGQRQRIGIARALARPPAILVADEPVSALDESVEAQVLRPLGDIRNRLGLTVLFITHDLRVASQVCDSIVVMYQGRVVESGPVAEVYAHPAHAYTQALMAAVPGLL